MNDADAALAGVERLYGREALERLRAATVTVVGVGGVGSWAAEALARSGVGRLVLVDLDDICVSNANRQLHTLTTTVGQMKVAAMAERLRLLPQSPTLVAIEEFFDASTAEAILSPRPHLVVDAIDAVPHKAALLRWCADRALPVVTCGGAGGRVDPTRIECGSLRSTGGDPLLREVRRALRHGEALAEDHAVWSTPAVYSREPQRLPVTCASDGAPRRLDCATGFGTAVHVIGTLGLSLAGLAIDELLRRP